MKIFKRIKQIGIVCSFVMEIPNWFLINWKESKLNFRDKDQN